MHGRQGDEDSRFEWRPQSPLRPGLYRLIVQLEPPYPGFVTLELDYEDQRGAGQLLVRLSHFGGGRYESTYHLPHPLVAAGVQPSAAGSQLRLRNLSVRRLGLFGRAGTLAPRAFRVLRRRPSDLLASLRRYRAAVAGGTLVALEPQGLTKSKGYEGWLAKYDDDPGRHEAMYRRRIAELPIRPAFSVLMDVGRSAHPDLEATIESVIRQFYPAVELLVTGPLASGALEEVASRCSSPERSIRVVATDDEAGSAARLNDALSQAKGAWVVVLNPGEILRPHAIAELAFALAAEPDVKGVYADEDRIDAAGCRHTPHFKPDWSPDLLQSWNYIGHGTAWRADSVRGVGGWRPGLGAGRDHDLFLRLTETLTPKEIRHLPKVLIQLRSDSTSWSEAQTVNSGPELDVQAVQDHLVRIRRRGRALPTQVGPVVRVIYEPPSPSPLVSIVIPTRDRVDLLEKSVGSILTKTTYRPIEVIIVDNLSSEAATSDYLSSLSSDERVRVLPYPQSFNFSAINNFAVAQAQGSVIALVNNDVEVISPGWLDEMVGHACRPEIGCVGAKLYYPDETIQHAGIVVGMTGIAGHPLRGLPRSQEGYFGRAVAVCNVSAVTAACLVVRRSVYEEVGGLDENDLAIAFNDVDFCLKVQQRGYLNLWTPFAEFYHYESVSRGREQTWDKAQRFAREINVMRHRWHKALLHDPYYSPHLSLSSEDYAVIG